MSCSGGTLDASGRLTAFFADSACVALVGEEAEEGGDEEVSGAGGEEGIT